MKVSFFFFPFLWIPLSCPQDAQSPESPFPARPCTSVRSYLTNKEDVVFAVLLSVPMPESMRFNHCYVEDYLQPMIPAVDGCFRTDYQAIYDLTISTADLAVIVSKGIYQQVEISENYPWNPAVAKLIPKSDVDRIFMTGIQDSVLFIDDDPTSPHVFLLTHNVNQQAAWFQVKGQLAHPDVGNVENNENPE